MDHIYAVSHAVYYTNDMTVTTRVTTDKVNRSLFKAGAIYGDIVKYAEYI